MITLRLRPMGAKHRKSYRIVVADSRSPVQGKYIEEIGFHDPRIGADGLRIKTDRARYWLSNGAQPSNTVNSLLRQVGVLDETGKMIPVPGTDADPLVEGYLQLLRKLDPDLKKQKDRQKAFAIKLAEATREWGDGDQDDDEDNFTSSDQELLTWIRDFASADNPSGRGNRSKR